MTKNNYNLYWICRNGHEDPEYQGYIGVSNNVNRRYSEHKKSNRKSALSDAMKSYEDQLEIVVLHKNLTKEEAFFLEECYRPEENIGWNLNRGGMAPPSTLGKKWPEMAKAMLGENNHFYGKNHTDEVKAKLSADKTGDKHPFYGKKRPDHSEKLKNKKGKDYPKFRGYFCTPFGKFDSYKPVVEKTKCSIRTVYKMCHENDSTITKNSFGLNKYIKENYDETVIGKTYKDLGFGFIWND